MANFTKNAIRASFLKLLDERPLSKITVKDITDDCGINRNSFYYHFQDIPSLVDENEKEMIRQIIKKMEDESGMDRSSAIADMRYDFIERVCEQTVVTYFRTAFPDAKLLPEDRDVLLHYHTCNTFGMVSGWLNSGMRLDMNTFSARLCEITRGMLAEMIRRCER